jgi:hypothetical protein
LSNIAGRGCSRNVRKRTCMKSGGIMSGDVSFGKVIAFVASTGFALYTFFAMGLGLPDGNNVSGLHTQAQALLIVWTALLVYFLYRSRGRIASLFRRGPDPFPFAPRTTLPKYWRCPNCKAILEKSEAGMSIDSSTMVGIVTCGSCRTQFSARDVYGGLTPL